MIEPTWHLYAISFAATPRLRRLALVGAMAVAAAVISGRGELAAVAAAPLVLLTLHPKSALPRRARVGVAMGPTRCLEDDELSLRLIVDLPGVERVATSLSVPAFVDAVLQE